MKSARIVARVAAGALAFAVAPAHAQSGQGASTAPPASTAAQVDPATLQRPDLSFEETPAIVDDYEKYFYFHRADTDFATALTDIRECDALVLGARMNRYAPSYIYTPYQYGVLGGAAGGLIGAIVSSAVQGAQARREQRLSRRQCMFFKGYDRFGISKDKWKDWNFEDGLSPEANATRERAVAIQALVASGPRPTTRVLGL